MSDVTCKIKNRSNEDMAARREYGSPLRKGFKKQNADGIMEYNTVYTDWNSLYYFPIESQKEFYSENIECLIDSVYVEFLQDRFYRIYKGYPVTYFELPLNDPKRLALYNQTALDSGHPEYMIDSDGNPLKISNNSEPVKTNLAIEDTKSKKEEKPVESGTMDVIDSEGNVVAENVGYVGEPKADIEVPESEQKPAEPTAKPVESDSRKVKQNAITFNPGGIDLKGASHEKDNPERKDDYKRHNEKFMTGYSKRVKSDLQKFIQLCNSENRVVRFDNLKGLIQATIYTKGVPESVDRTIIKRAIDPYKIRNGLYVLTEDADSIANGTTNPLCAVGISIDDPCLKDYLFRQISDQDAARLVEASNVGSGFYRYISYNAFDNDEIKFAIANTYYLCERLQLVGLDMRFKVIAKKDENNFDLGITDNVGLGLFATDNNRFKGLVIEVRYKDGFIFNTAVGEHASEFVKTVNTIGAPIVFDGTMQVTQEQVKATEAAIEAVEKAAEQVQQEANAKANAKKIEPAKNKKAKKQTVEIPAGRK